MSSRTAPTHGPTGQRTRIFLTISAALVASGAFHLVVFWIDDRPWAGPVSWRKPADFGFSFGVMLASVCWVTSYLRIVERTRTLLLAVFAADCVVEVAGITVQAWRGVPSHLNRSTPFDTVVAAILAAGGAVLVVTLGTFAVVAILGRTDGPPSLRLALRAGFVLLLLGLASGVAMIAVGTVAMNTGAAAPAYRITGFLKAFHGVTLHGVLVLPALAWVLERRPAWTERSRVRVVATGVAAYVVAAVAVLVVELASVS